MATWRFRGIEKTKFITTCSSTLFLTRAVVHFSVPFRTSGKAPLWWVRSPKIIHLTGVTVIWQQLYNRSDRRRNLWWRCRLLLPGYAATFWILLSTTFLLLGEWDIFTVGFGFLWENRTTGQGILGVWETVICWYDPCCLLLCYRFFLGFIASCINNLGPRKSGQCIYWL